MNIRILAVSALALSLLAPAAFAGNSFGNPNLPAGTQAANQLNDYPVALDDVFATKAFAAKAGLVVKSAFSGSDYIDESNVERNQRSSH
jgi:hypothetical protein